MNERNSEQYVTKFNFKMTIFALNKSIRTVASAKQTFPLIEMLIERLNKNTQLLF